MQGNWNSLRGSVEPWIVHWTSGQSPWNSRTLPVGMCNGPAYDPAAPLLILLHVPIIPSFLWRSPSLWDKQTTVHPYTALRLSNNNCWYTQWLGWLSKTLYWVKEASFKNYILKDSIHRTSSKMSIWTDEEQSCGWQVAVEGCGHAEVAPGSVWGDGTILYSDCGGSYRNPFMYSNLQNSTKEVNFSIEQCKRF